MLFQKTNSHAPNILSDRWEKFRYHPLQAKAFHSKARFINLACGRRSGKTELARRKLVIACAEKKPWRRPQYFYALPTYEQAEKVAWGEILQLIPKPWIKSQNIMKMRIETIFGSIIYIVGMDKPQRIEGLAYDGGIIDESCDQKPGSYDLSVRPALSDRKGWCWRIGVPKRSGVGSAEFREVFEKGLKHNDLDMASYAWPSSDVLPSEEIAAAKRELDPKDFREQYEASWEQAGGLVFYTFDKNIHVTEDIKYWPHLPLYIGMDFNVDPMCWVVGHVIENYSFNNNQKSLIIFDEVVIRDTNTPEALDALYSRYSNHSERIYFYGDAASRQRKTSASLSDYLHICNSNKFGKKKIFIPKSNPPIADRFSATNCLLMNEAKEIKLFIHPRCKWLIHDLSYRAYKEGTCIPNDIGDIGHITDALGYLIWSEFPLRINKIEPNRVAIQSFK
jgi:hypothetical protein